MPTKGRVTAARGRREREGDLTPAWLQERGFKHHKYGIGGQDQWAGMDSWMYENKHGDRIPLLGNISTSFGGWLSMREFPGAMITLQEEINQLIKLLTYEGKL